MSRTIGLKPNHIKTVQCVHQNHPCTHVFFLPAKEVFAVTPVPQASGTIFLNPGSIPAGSIGNLQKPEIARHAVSAGRAV